MGALDLKMISALSFLFCGYQKEIGCLAKLVILNAVYRVTLIHDRGHWVAIEAIRSRIQATQLCA